MNAWKKLPDDSSPEGRNNALRLLGIVWQMIGMVLLFFGIGWLVDEKWFPGAKPWGMLGFTLFGVIASMVLVIREVNRMRS
jgi:F0F1-type ATP synthase assembly protein I